MLIKYDAKSRLWIASMLVDGQPVMCLSRNMAIAMQLLSAVSSGPVGPVHEPIPLLMHGGFVACDLSSGLP